MFRKVALYINIAVSLGLAFCIAGCWFSPEKLEWLILAPLSFPYFFVLNALFIPFWPIASKEHKKYALLSLVCLLLSTPAALNTYAFSGKSEVPQYKILSWNVRNFDLYNWSHNRETRKKMLQLIDSTDADILCFQEFYSEKEGKFDNLKKISIGMGYPYFHFHQTVIVKNKHQWGLAIFSKFPLHNKQFFEFPNSSNNQMIWCDAELPEGKNLRLFNTHLQSLYFNSSDYQTIEQAVNQQDAEEKKIFGLLGKYKQAALKRAKQADWLRAEMDRHQGSKILCGDFNEVPASYTYQRLSSGMQDAFLKKGKGLGGTYINPYPFLRIDYILMHKDIEIKSFDRSLRPYSDHYPIIAGFSL